ncbi:MAG: VCBS repeat-containing protein [Planctomycetota bacterium]
MTVRFSFLAPVLLIPTPALAQQELLAEVHRMVPAGVSAGTELGAVDVDGDGDLDLVAAHVNAQNQLFLGDGNGRFDLGALPPNPAPVNNSADVALGDVDGDGDADALFANFGPFLGDPLIGQDRLLLGDGQGGFVDATGQLPVEQIGSQSVDFGDVDLDGDLDAAVAYGVIAGFADPYSSVVLTNDGAGVFTESAGFAPPAEASRNLCLADLDADGNLDLLETFAAIAPRVYRNGGAGDFVELAGAFSDFTATPFNVDLGDVDGDSDLDLVGFDGSARLWLNDGAGFFADASGQLPTPPGLTYDGVLADLDGDGDLDVAAGQRPDIEGPPVPDVLYVNDGLGLFTDASQRLPDVSTTGGDFLALDVDRDLDVDLLQVQSNAEQGFVRLYLSDGLDFEDVTSPFGTPGRAFDVAVDDLDGDGDLDALVAGVQSGPRLYRNVGAGELVPEDAGLADAPILAVATGDVDGDGDPDALFGSTSDRFYLNDGSASFTPGAELTTTFFSTTEDAALVDVDGDGDLDAFLASTVAIAFGAPDRLVLGDGAGGFTDASAQIDATVRASFAVAPGDVDLDGDVDFLIASLGPNELLLGDGAGGFVSAASQLPGDSLSTKSAALVDVDGDGDLDALFGNDGQLGGSGQNQLHLGDGTGFFVDAPGRVPSAPGGESLGLAVGDPDGDGDVDAYFANGSGLEAQLDELWLNDGSGNFTLGAMPPVVAPGEGVALADLDGDGDDDALVCGRDLIGLRQLAGLKRHVAWRAVPRIGKPLAMDLRGDPGSVWVLASSAKAASFDLGALGVLGIDPSTLITVDVGQLDGDGRALREFQVPADATLVGGELLWQALLGIPAAFTNVERAVFREL